ncbi:hypothetical protein APR04_000625 [Promicromonospora umidemergens]|nr:VOC family protein [Promicromonospora umidemergens]MCP2281736.1 hypothetical protein [Promicromonospora umidemergens]
MADTPTTPRTYPHGVPSWIDLETQDVDAALDFYGELFGWKFTEKLPPGAPGAMSSPRWTAQMPR